MRFFSSTRRFRAAVDSVSGRRSKFRLPRDRPRPCRKPGFEFGAWRTRVRPVKNQMGYIMFKIVFLFIAYGVNSLSAVVEALGHVGVMQSGLLKPNFGALVHIGAFDPEVVGEREILKAPRLANSQP